MVFTFGFLLEPIFDAWSLWFRLIPLMVVAAIVYAIVATLVGMFRDRSSASTLTPDEETPDTAPGPQTPTPPTVIRTRCAILEGFPILWIFALV